MKSFISRNSCHKWISITALAGTLFLMALNTSANNEAFQSAYTPANKESFDSAYTPARVTLENNGTQLLVITPNAQWQMSLERFSLLGIHASIQRALHDIPYFYRGQILGQDNSWVRINSDVDLTSSSTEPIVELKISGHIFINNELFKLQHSDKTGHSLVAIPDTLSGSKSLKAGNDPAYLNSLPRSDREMKTSPLKAIKIGVMVDSRYNELHNGDGLVKALEVISGVDGLFQDQLGLALIVERFKSVQDPQTDSLRNYSGSMEHMLYEFRRIRQNDAELPAELALVHLFTGHNDPDKLIGVSWIDTLCQLDGYDVSISTHYPHSILLSAHEIAHNLGAVHDNDQQCLADPSITGSQVMWSELSNSTQTDFSACSLNSMRQSLSSSCVQENIDMTVTLKSTPTSFLSEQQVEVSAINLDAERTSGHIISITRFPESTHLSNQQAGCVLTNSTMTCQHGSISANSQSIYSVTALLSNSATPIISNLYFSDFTDLNNSDNVASVQPSLTDVVISPAPPLNDLAIDNDANNRAVAIGASSGLGSFGALGIFWLGVFCYATTLNRRRQTGS